ncbi:MAG TPA: hypothetical protein VGQ62_08085 [Chloroflexota bacterium]|nr:hypothetical protein [Chloroflexota bacterium]
MLLLSTAWQAAPDDALVAPPLEVLLPDAAQRMVVDIGAVRVLHVQKFVWSDSTLGCPNAPVEREPGATPGWMVALLAGDHLLDYRTDDFRGRVILCDVHESASPPA